MLTRDYIEDLIHMRLPQEAVRAELARLAPETLDDSELTSIIEAVESCLAVDTTALSEAGAEAIDCCGTGGSSLHHFNTSTATAFVLAAAEVKVAKFGNQAASGACGSFDFLRALGFTTEVAPSVAATVLKETGIVFMYAPAFYPVLRQFTAVRKSIAARTVFNFIGPLLNPARPAYRLLGVSDRHMQSLIAQHLRKSGTTRQALIVTAANGLDEIDAAGTTKIQRVVGKEIFYESFQPANNAADCAQLPMLHVEASVQIFSRLLSGQDTKSYYYQLLTVNAGAAFFTCRKTASIAAGIELAGELLRSGAVLHTLDKVRRSHVGFSH